MKRPTGEVFEIPEGGWDKWCTVSAVKKQFIPVKTMSAKKFSPLKVSVKEKKAVKKKIAELTKLTCRELGRVQVRPGRMECTADAHCMHLTCTADAHCMHLTCTTDAYCMHLTCTNNASNMHLTCTTGLNLHQKSWKTDKLIVKRGKGKGKGKDYLDWYRVLPAFVPGTFMETTLVYNCCKHVSMLGADKSERNSVYTVHPTKLLHMLTRSKPKAGAGGAYEFTYQKDKVKHI